jgi:hypothetical protein
MALFQNVTAVRVIKKFRAFYGIRKFTSILTRGYIGGSSESCDWDS